MGNSRAVLKFIELVMYRYFNRENKMYYVNIKVWIPFEEGLLSIIAANDQLKSKTY
jgi:hypothetical protein